MARVSSKPKPNPPKTQKNEEPEANALKRKRVEAVNSLVRARDGSAFTRCDECNKDVPVMLVDMHSCSLDSKIKMKMESMVVERAVEEKQEKKEKKPVEKKKSGKTAPKPKTKKAKSSNPNMPKKPPTAFFIFMDDFRKEYKEEHPDSKGISAVGKAGGEKWKAMPEEEKKVYLDKAAELKAQYVETVAKLNAGTEINEEQGNEVENELEDEIEEEEGAEEEKEE